VRRILRLLPWTMVLAAFLFALGTWKALPAEIPMGIDARGNADRLTEKLVWSWFGLPMLALGTVALLAGLRALMPRRPELFNHPEKERFLKLPAAYRGQVFEEIGSILDVTATFVGLTVLEVQFILFRAASSRPVTAALPILLVTTILIAPAVLLMLTRVNAAVERAERQWIAAGRPTE
jgi:uncharacterized membrane protein